MQAFYDSNFLPFKKPRRERARTRERQRHRKTKREKDGKKRGRNYINISEVSHSNSI
jgi:hypothetical protein